MARSIPRSAGGRLLVLFVAATVALGGGFLLANTASSAPVLPQVTAEQLTASVIRALAAQPSVSGDVATHVDLGLPQLPGIGPDELTGPASLIQYVSGDHHLRVWSSKDGLRLADLLPAAERSILVGRTVLWAWDSATLTAYRLGPFPAGGAGGGTTGNDGSAGMNRQDSPAGLLDPVTLARRSLGALAPTTAVSVSANEWVAGRPTYTLVLQPRTTATLVGRVEISVDSSSRLPLRAAVFPRGTSSPAVSAAFTSVSFAPIAPSEFRFTPPPGAKVVDVLRSAPRPLPGAGMEGTGHAKPGSQAERRALERMREYVRFFGSGWAAIVAYRVPPTATLQEAAGMDLAALLPFSGTLLSVRLVDRGDHAWLVAGAVPQSALARVGPRLP